MRIIVDFADPVNDMEVEGLPEGAEPGQQLGPHGAIIWRMFSAIVRTLFLARQTSDVAAQALGREFSFIEERIREYRRLAGGSNGSNSGGKRR